MQSFTDRSFDSSSTGLTWNYGVWIAVHCVSRPAQELIAASSTSLYAFGKSDVTKGGKVYLRMENVVVTQHVANIETLTQEQTELLQSSVAESACVSSQKERTSEAS